MRNNSISTKRRIIPQFAVPRRVSKSKFIPVLIWFFCFAIGYSLAAQPLDIGNRRQVFIDGKFLAWDPSRAHTRLPLLPMSYLEREGAALMKIEPGRVQDGPQA